MSEITANEFTKTELEWLKSIGIEQSPYLMELIYKDVSITHDFRIGIKDTFIKNGLLFWLQCDLWSVEEGILLLAGINPNHLTLEWSEKSGGGIEIPVIHESVFKYLDEKNIVYPPKPPNTKKTLPHPTDEDFYHLEMNLFNKRVPDLKRSIAVLNAKWKRTQHKSNTDQYSPSYFIEWATSKQHEPIWLDWAIRHNLLTTNGSKKLPENELSEQGKNSYRRTVRALAQALIGTIDSRPNSATVRELIRHIEDLGVKNPQSERTWKSHLSDPDDG